MKQTYIPSKDKLILKIHPVRGRPKKKSGPFELWSDDEGNIRAIAITEYTKELEEFRRHLGLVQLGGIWKGTRITDEDIRKAREELTSRLEEKW